MEEEITYNYIKIKRGEIPLCVIRVIKGSIEEMITVDILTDKGLILESATEHLYNSLASDGAGVEYFNEEDLSILQEIDWDEVDIDFDDEEDDDV
jgi:hypothetical protein